jgi:hypothetical protein
LTHQPLFLALTREIGGDKDAEFSAFLDKRLLYFKTVSLLLGNHEPYHSSWALAKQKLHQLETEIREKKETLTSEHPSYWIGLASTSLPVSPF